MDLAFRDAEGWTVVDYKTDQELATHADIYRRQVALYARALTAATDVHHIVPRRDGGPDEEDNLMALCHACHSRVTGQGG